MNKKKKLEKDFSYFLLQAYHIVNNAHDFDSGM